MTEIEANNESAPEKRRHFIRQLIENDLAEGKHQNIVTRFPPEPNGYLHVGHAKSICLNFGLAEEFNGKCYLRFDDTNPTKEEQEYVDAIKEDVHWLGFDWQNHEYHASDYFQQLYDFAVSLIKQGKAYVDSLSAEEIREHRGTLTSAGKYSPYRERSIEENLDLFQRMKNGEFENGAHVVRAKIDMASGNINMRDPVLYRILHAEHQRTGKAWCIYPMYDFAHPLSDAIEEITHSFCTLEFQDHRPLYEWFIEHCQPPGNPVQTEFARLNLSHTITSKRKLRALVEEKLVSGWDDPRLPTLKGLRRRGFPPAAIRNFCEMIGASKRDSIIDMSVLEECVRDELNTHALRTMAVLDPLKITIENFPEGESLKLQAPNHPQNEDMGKRDITFSKEIFIEREDFMEKPSKKFFRLALGKEVRLRNAFVIECVGVIKDENGEVIELTCRIDENSLGKNPEGRKVKGVIHWVDANNSKIAEVRMYDRLFNHPNPASEEDFHTFLNPNSLETKTQCRIEPNIANAQSGQAYQFERMGYFCVDKESKTDQPIFNKVVGLRDTWAKLNK